MPIRLRFYRIPALGWGDCYILASCFLLKSFCLLFAILFFHAYCFLLSRSVFPCILFSSQSFCFLFAILFLGGVLFFKLFRFSFCDFVFPFRVGWVGCGWWVGWLCGGLLVSWLLVGGFCFCWVCYLFYIWLVLGGLWFIGWVAFCYEAGLVVEACW